jgi:hypothetical protein
MHHIEERLGDAAVPQEEHDALLERYSGLQDRFRIEDGYDIDLKVATVLRGLGSATCSSRSPRIPCPAVADAAGAAVAAGMPHAAAAGRADEPSRSRGAQLARGVSQRLSQRRHPGVTRSTFLDAVVTRIADLNLRVLN